jgi:hypothetical protein
MTYTSEEIKELLLYVQQIGKENEELRAKMIAMDAMLKNEMAKTKKLTQILKLYEANSYN